MKEPPRIVARVGRTVITSADVEKEAQEGLAALLAVKERAVRAGRWEESKEAELRRAKELVVARARRGLLLRAAQAEVARSAGFRPDEAFVERQVKDILRSDRQPRRSRSALALREELKQLDLRRKFRRYKLPPSRAPSPRAVREYYGARPEGREQSPRVRVRLMRVPEKRGEALATELREHPERFESLARRCSTHKESAERGGLLVVRSKGAEHEWLPLEALPRAFAGALDGLRAGGVSEPLRDGDSVVFLKLEEWKKGKKLSLPEATGAITDILRKLAEDELLEDWTDYYLRRLWIAGEGGRRSAAEEVTVR